MAASTISNALDYVQRACNPITDSATDYDSVLAFIGEATVVLLGEASHGTHEFYRSRAQITQRLILEKGFSGIAVEADWPDAYRVNRFVQRDSGDQDALQSLGGLKRFPAWMWRNADVLEFVCWLRHHNNSQDQANRIGFYGLDLYSLHASIECVLRYLDDVDPRRRTEPETVMPASDCLGMIRKAMVTLQDSVCSPPARARRYPNL